MTAAPAFKIERIQIGAGNTDHFGRRSFGEAFLAVGPFHCTAHVLPCGEVSLPPSLHDAALRRAISRAVRARVLDVTRERWGAKTAAEAQGAGA